MNRVKDFSNRYFISDKLPFETRVLNFVCCIGALAAVAALISRCIAGLPFFSMAPLLVMIVSLSCMLMLAVKFPNLVRALTAVIVCSISLVFWPILFFTVGGAESGMVVYFALAIILDFTLLKGKTRIFALALSLAVGMFCYMATLYWGFQTLPAEGLSHWQRFVELIQSFLIVGVYTGIIFIFQTRLYQIEKDKAEAAKEEIAHGEQLMTMINESAVILLTTEADRFEEALMESMSKIGRCLDIDCIYIWRANDHNGELSYTKLYDWFSPNTDNTRTFQSLSGSNVLPHTPQLDRLLLGEQGYIAETADKFDGFLGEAMAKNGVQAILAFSVFFQGDFWGFVSFENRHSKELCSDRESAILQSGTLLLANAVQRNESTLQLRAAQLTVSAMFDSNPHINILFDSNFRVIDCNPAAVTFMRFPSKEEMLEGFIARITGSIPDTQPDGRPSVPLPVRLVTAAKEGYVKFETELHMGGEVRNLDVEFKRIPYEGSFAIVAHVFDMTDIHEREMELRRRDQQLSEAVEEALAANQAKSVFLSTMSHEIRTPMNAILGITEIQLQNESLEPTVREALGKIYTSGDMLLGIINDILDLSRIEAGKLELVIDKYETASLISDTAQLNMMRIGSKPIEFELHVDETTPAILSGDELRVKQILNNILSNAFKYTIAGKVILTITTENHDKENMINLVMTISDTGQGMTKEQVEKLFDEYSRFNMEANRATEGTGLGMSITRNLVRLMEGEIFIESEPGVGSTFTVRLPQERIGAAVLGKEMVENLQQFRTSTRAQMRRVQITREPMPYGSVLIVDDVETNIYVARGLMSPYGLKIDSADSGPEAIEKIKSGNEYDIVFMDHMMPQMDGIEATGIIRGMGYKHPIVALTANAVSGQADVFLGNGFDDFISKPIDIRQLNNVLNKLIRDKQSPETIEAARLQAITDKEHNGIFNDGSGAPDELLMPAGPPDGGGQSGEGSASAGAGTRKAVDPHIIEIFVRDADKSIAVLDGIHSRGVYGEEDVRTYTITIHGIKSALANIGEKELSDFALRLEQAGRDDETALLSGETSAFLDGLRVLVDGLRPAPAGDDAAAATDEDPAYLSEKLQEIKAACEDFNKKGVKDALTELREKTWSPPTREKLDAIAEHLLHSDFDEILVVLAAF